MFEVLEGVDRTVTSFAEVWIEIKCCTVSFKRCRVTSFAEVWIEMPDNEYEKIHTAVTSFAEVWIEIF